MSIARPREDGTYGSFEPVEADRLYEGLRGRCVAAIERYRAEHGTAPNRLVIETTGQVLATAQTGEERAPPARHSAWEGRAGVEEAGTEADARTDEQRHEREEWERRRRLADRCATRSDEALATLRHRAEEALAADGVDRTHLGYEVLVKLKMDEFLERDYLRMAVEDGREPLEEAAVDPRTGEASVISGSGMRGPWKPARCRSMALNRTAEVATPSA